MKKLFFLLFFSSLLFAKVNVVVSIMPQVTFVKSIGGDRVDVSLMVLAGDSPHTYEPKPSQMINISKADIYFSIGVEFEAIWLDKLKYQNRDMLLVDSSKGVKREFMIQNRQLSNRKKDPHIWTTPANVKIVAKNIYMALAKIDPQNQLYYRDNFDKYIEKLDGVDRQIRDILKSIKSGTNFIAFHPSWGYFAREYNLTQLSVEIEGKSPKFKDLIKLIKIAKKKEVKAIFTQPEFSDKSAKIIATELNIKVIKVSPLNQKWSKNLIQLAKAIANR